MKFNFLSKYRVFLFATILVSSLNSAHAGIIHTTNRIYSNSVAIPVPSSFPSFVATAPDTSGRAFQDASIMDLISIGINHDTDLYVIAPHVYQVYFTVTSGGFVEQFDLRLEYNPTPGAIPNQDKSTHVFSGHSYFDLTVDSILDNGSQMSIVTSLIYIEGDVIVERYEQFDTDTLTMYSPRIISFNCDTVPDEIQFNWQTRSDIEEYELEWAFINDYDVSAGLFKSKTNLSFDFRYNSTRISTDKSGYRLPLIFEHGYVIFRVRGVGRDYLNPSVHLIGNWNSLDSGSVNSTTHYYWNQITHEKVKNWQLSTTFAEQGKRKEVIVYADGSSRTRQSVTQLSSDSLIIVGETVYDMQGRPAINILPVPNYSDCNNWAERNLKYYPMFNVQDSGFKYSAQDFDFDASDVDSCSTLLNPLNSVSGAAEYYSGNNPVKSSYQGLVPESNGYPFSQTEYTPDNTGRIRRQGGVGPQHQLESTHETKNIYGQPNQIQLDRLFGSEVGDAAHYKKNVVIDANGQSSVSYLNQAGKVIATSLAGDAPKVDPNQFRLSPLSSIGDAAKPFEVDLFSKDDNGFSSTNSVNVSQDAIVFSTQLTVPFASEHTFAYSIGIAAYKDSCLKPNICFNCIYDLELSLLDDCGALVTSSGVTNPIIKKLGHFTGSGDSIMYRLDCDSLSDSYTMVVNLNPGNYTLSKRLSIDTVARNFYVQQYLDSAINSCFYQLSHFEETRLAGLDTMCCYIDCISCLANLGSKEEFVSQGRGLDYDYDYLYEQCQKPCKPITDCESKYEMMLSDMTKDGQYAEYDDNGVFNPSHFRLSVLNEDNSLPQNVIDHTGNWRIPSIDLNGENYSYYLDENGKRSTVSLLEIGLRTYYPEVLDTSSSAVFYDDEIGFYTDPQNLKRVEDFISIFQDSWAKSLVKYHPEYCYYKVCREMGVMHENDSITSDAFDNLMMLSITFNQAMFNGLINIADSSIINYLFKDSLIVDPFFVNNITYQNFSTSPDLLATMTDKFFHYKVVDHVWRSMEEIAASVVRCSFNNYPWITSNSDCFDFGSDFYQNTVFNYEHKNDSIRDLEWVTFRAMYQAEKKKLLKKLQDKFARNDCSGWNGCIGKPSYNPWTAGMISFLPGQYFPWVNPTQPCGSNAWWSYLKKDKRFTDENDIPNSSQNAALAQYYQATGQCPLTAQFQMFINALASRGNLIDTISLKYVPEFAMDLYDYLFNPQNLANSDSLGWMFVDSSNAQQDLIGIIRNLTTGAPVCTLVVHKGTSVFYWIDISGFIQVEYVSTNGGMYEFNATAIELQVDQLNNTVKNALHPVTGSTCFKLGPCEFEDVCESNQLAKDLEILISLIAFEQSMNSPSTAPLILSNTPYSQFVTQRIINAVKSPNGNLVWYQDINNLSNYIIENLSNSPWKLRINFSSSTPGIFISHLSDLYGFRDLTRKSKYLNTFIVTGLDQAGAEVARFEGNVVLDNGSSELQMTLGDCGSPASISCVGRPNELRRDLEVLLRDVLVQQKSQSSMDLLASPYISPLILSNLSFYVSATTSSITNTTIGVDSTLDSLTFQFVPDSVDCEMVLRQFDYAGGNLQFNELVDIKGLTGIDPTDNFDNFLSFYFIGVFDHGGSLVTDTVWGNSCFGIQNCPTCEPEIVSNPSPTFKRSSQSGNQTQPELKSPVSKDLIQNVLNSYLQYRKVIGQFNQRFNLLPTDKNYLSPVSITEYYRIVNDKNAKEYFDYLENFSGRSANAKKLQNYFGEYKSSSIFDSGYQIKPDFSNINSTKFENKSFSFEPGQLIESSFTYHISNFEIIRASSHGGFVTSCPDLQDAMDAYANLPSSIRPPLTMWLNHYLNANHTYSYYYYQLLGCSITVPNYGPSCIDLNNLVHNCIDNHGLSGLFKCLNLELGLNFSVADYIMWMDSCQVFPIKCSDLQKIIDDYNALTAAFKPPFLVYLHNRTGMSLSYSNWNALFANCNKTMPNSSFACDSLAYYYSLFAEQGTSDITSQLNSIFNLNFVWKEYTAWLDSCGTEYIDCNKLQQAINSFNALPTSVRPPAYVWLNHQMNLSFTWEQYVVWLDRCQINEPEYKEGSCDSIITLFQSCGSVSLSQLVACLESQLHYSFTIQDYLLWLDVCGQSIIDCDTLKSYYNLYTALSPRPPFLDYMNLSLGISLTFSDYLLMFNRCNFENPDPSLPCRKIEDAYFICQQNGAPYKISDCLNFSLGWNYPLSYYFAWMDSCNIRHDTINCDLLERAIHDFKCFQDTMTLTAWLNYYFQATNSTTFYQNYMDGCNLSLKCCNELSEALSRYPCEDGPLVSDYLNHHFSVNFSPAFWLQFMRQCKLVVPCEPCELIKNLLNRFVCQDTLTVYEYLASETGYIYTIEQWDNLIRDCGREVPCEVPCEYLAVAISEYNCSDSLVAYLNNYFGYIYSGDTWLTYLDSCHISLKCLDCNSFRDLIASYHCFSDGPLEAWLNSQLGYSLSLDEYLYQMEICDIHLDCDSCQILENYFSEYDCKEGKSVAYYLNKITNFNFSDSVWISMLDSCKINWKFCAPCDLITAVSRDYPCNSSTPLWVFLNTTLSLSYSQFEWDQILIKCPVNRCDTCSRLNTLSLSYPCHGTRDLFTYLNDSTGWNFTDTKFITLLDSCHISWTTKCISCDSLKLVNSSYPCNSITPRWVWLNTQLNFHYSQYEWDRIFIKCPVTRCDTCTRLSALSQSYPCNGTRDLSTFLRDSTGWNYSDTTFISLLDSCNISWKTHCVNCDSIRSIASGYPCNSSTPLWSWLNGQINLHYSAYQWKKILVSCPIDTIRCHPCDTLGPLLANYNCHDTLTLAAYLEGLVHFGWNDSTLMVMMDSCGVDSLWWTHCVSCDSIKWASRRYPCGSSIGMTAWLNQELNLHFTDANWDRIFAICPVDTIHCHPCDTIVSLLANYNCHDTLTLAAYLEGLVHFGWNDSTLMVMMDSCGVDSLWWTHCVSCDSIKWASRRYPCGSSIGMTAWLNQELNLHFTDANWDRIFAICPVDTIHCHPCDTIVSLLANYNCHDTLTLAAYLEGLVHFGWNDSTLMVMMDSCGVDSLWWTHCVSCDSIKWASRRYPCGSTIGMTAWLNQELNLHFTDANWDRIFAICPVDTIHCNPCDTLGPLLANYSCHDTLTLSAYLEGLVHFGWNDSTLMVMMDSCGVDSLWWTHCVSCDSIKWASRRYPCGSSIGMTAWLNQELNLHFTDANWDRIFAICPVDTIHCHPCDTLGPLLANYSCHDTLTLAAYLEGLIHFGWNDSTLMVMMDSCGVDSLWWTHCVSCDSIKWASRRYPCGSSIGITAWLNQELNLHFTDANWDRIFAICPVDTIHCHPCDTLGPLLANYSCHDTLTLAAYLEGLIHFGWNDSTLMVMMDSCGVDSLWWTHCVSCDSIKWASRRYPCGSSIGITAWLNQELNLHFTDANWDRIFAICPVDTIHCHPCDTLGPLLANYNCHDTLTLASYLEGLLHFGWNDSTLMVMMDSCGVDSLWWTHCVSCDSIKWASRRYPCGSSIGMTAWLNQELNLHFTDANWDRIFAICPVDTIHCHPCDTIGSLVANYNCHDTLTLAAYLEGLVHFGWNDSTLMVMMDSCEVDSLWWTHCVSCDSIQWASRRYPCGGSVTLTAWLNQELNLHFTDANWDRIFAICPVGDTCTSPDSCAIYYQTYQLVYHSFVLAQMSSNSCPNYTSTSPLYTYQEFLDHNLCCTDTGFAMYADYIASFIATPPCPSGIPTADTCVVVPSFTYCDSIYHEYLTAIAIYNISPWAIAHSHMLYPGIYNSSWAFQNAYDCSCASRYIDSLAVYSSANPSQLLPLPLPIISTPLCNEFSECEQLYYLLNQRITSYNNSPYAIAHDDSLEYPFASYTEFLTFRFCNCAENYISYLDTLIALPANGTHDSTVTIFGFEGCGDDPVHPHSECDDAYGKYSLSVNEYNQYILTHSVPSGTPAITIVYPASSFTSTGFCYCVSNYTSYLQSIITTLLPNGISLTPGQVIQLDIAEFCDGTYDCHDTLPQFAILDTMIIMDSSMVNNCAQQLIEIELQNAWIEYNEYLDSLRTSVSADYTRHCLSPFENFIQNYDDKEYHFTLYYYDQAGNLVKTIPPEGVSMLPITSYTDSVEKLIIHDRTYGEQTIFTEHNMPTIYEYNSLNQLVKQNLPDHDPMDIWDFGLPSGLPSSLHITSTQFVTSNKAYLTGYIQNGTENRGYVFTSNDAGNTWKQLYDLVAADFNKVQMVNSSVGYAVGNDGVVVKTIDGGNTWDLISTYVFTSGTSDSILVNLRDLHVLDNGSGNYSGYVAGDFGSLYQLTDNGTSVAFNKLAVPSPASKTFTSLTHNGTDFYAAGYNNLDEGFIYQLSGSSLTAITDFTTVGLSKIFYLKKQTQHAFAVGLDGNLLKTIDGGASWKMIHTGIRKDIKDIFFVNDNIGLALIDSAANNNQLFKTWNGGKDWERLGEKGEYYNSMHFVDSTQGIAVGKKGVIKRIITNSSNYEPYFGLINVVKPTGTLSTIEFTAVTSSMVSVSGSGIKNYATIVSADGQFFTTRDIAASSVAWRALSPVLAAGNPVTNIAQQIVKVTDTAGTVLTDLYLYRIPFINSLDEAQCYVEKNAGTTVQGTFISAPVSTSIPELYQLQKSPLTNDIYGIGKIVLPSPADLMMYMVSIDTVPTIPVLVFDDYSSTSAFSSMTRPSSFDISEQDSVLVSSMDAGAILARSMGVISTTTSFDNESWSIAPLSIYDIEPMNVAGDMITSGADGSIMTSTTTGPFPSFTNLIGYNSSKLNAVCADQLQGFAAGDSGKLYTLTLSSSQVVFSPVSTGTISNLNDLAFVNATTASYVSGDKGTFLKIPEFLLANTTQKMVPAPLTTNFNGVVFRTDGSGVFAVGSGSAIYNYNANNGVKIKPVFVHALKDVHFRDANEGFAVGEHGIIRHTKNAGISWDVIKPNYDASGNLPVYKSVWATGPDQCLVSGTGDYLTQLAPNGLLSNLRSFNNSSSTSWNDIKFGKDVRGYAVSSDGKGAPLTYNSASNSVTVGALLTSPGGNQFNALHIFNDNNFIAVGPANTISTYINGSWIDQSLTSSGSSSNVYNDVFFHDDRNGYVVGDAGLIYRASTRCNIQNEAANSVIWYKRTDKDAFIISDPDTATVDIKVVAFPGRYRGWVAGTYPGTLMNTMARGSTYPYGRLLHDESFLYSSTFWYDKVGRLVISQNTKQFNCEPKRYSYTVYDHLGRIGETGEKLDNTGTIIFSEIFGDLVNSTFNPKVLNDSLYRDWLANSTGLRREVTRTFYDTAAFSLKPFTTAMSTTTYDYYQENLRNRVVSTTYADTYVADSTYYDFATHYSYDIHGNVKSLLQDNRKLSIVSSMVLPQRFKRIDYSYDLISGKVNTVDLQKGYPDQFSHRYEYDADNRITEVFTSTNGVHWDRDASYYYYAHGPLARVELGDNMVQGIDYAYTLHGWIKGVNSNIGDAAHDIGKDGQAVTTNPNRNIAKDAYGYTLNYYAGDYSPIDASRAADSIRFEANTTGSDVMASRADLYNGNITLMATTISAPIVSNSALLAPLPQANAYEYDQLNRVLASRSYTNLDIANNKWNTGSTYANRYFNQFSYDANGNITNQARYGETGGIIDQFHYLYESHNSCNDATMRTVRNRLDSVVNTSSGSPETMVFAYDAIGNLVKEDSAQIDTIYWTVSGKIKEIVRTTSSTMKGLRFDYDPSGNRIAKHVYASNNTLETSTYYVRDAQGNILSTYELNPSSYMVKEREIYGSSRLGITKDSLELIGVDSVGTTMNFTRPIGLKRYELTNHLGNVLATISDRKLPYSSNTTTIDFYQPDILSANDYYPGGMLQPGRSFSSSAYRFGFNGQEKTDEISGNGNHYTAEFWEYNPRIVRRWNIDPVVKPWESGYAVMGNNPIWNKDPYGDDFVNVHTERKKEAKQKRDEAGSKLEDAKEGFKSFEGMTKKDAKSSGVLKEFKQARSELNTAQKNFNKADATYNREVEYEAIVNDVLDQFKSVNPEKFAEFDKFDPFNRGVIDVHVSAQTAEIQMLDANGFPTGRTTVEGINARLGNANHKEDYVRVRLKVIKVDGIVKLQSMTGSLVHGLGHIEGGKRHDETHAVKYQKEQFEDKLKKK